MKFTDKTRARTKTVVFYVADYTAFATTAAVIAANVATPSLFSKVRLTVGTVIIGGALSEYTTQYALRKTDEILDSIESLSNTIELNKK